MKYTNIISNCINMSCTFNMLEITEQSDDISRELEIEIKSRYNPMFAPKKYIILYQIIGDRIKLPFFYARNVLGEKPNRGITFPNITSRCTIDLYEKQKKVKSELVRLFNTDGCALLAAHTGFGKTAIGINLICKIKLKCVILSHLIIITQQWIDSYIKFTDNARIAQFRSNSTFNDDIDVYIINPDILPKLNFPFNKIGLVICDEAHFYCSPKRSQAFGYFSPKYLLGLTATPDEKTDGTNKVLDHVFGTKIYRKFWQKHNVYYYKTDFIPEYTLNEQGKTDWHSVLKSQAIDDKRNNIIVKMCEYFYERNILVLCKRKVQASYLLKALQDNKVDVDVYMASQKRVNYTCRVLIATYSKGGVGFDHPKLNMLILASDVEAYIQQYIGRVFRGSSSLKSGEYVIIVDFIDKFDLLVNHWKTRRRYLKKIGGVIRDFKSIFNIDDDFIVV